MFCDFHAIAMQCVLNYEDMYIFLLVIVVLYLWTSFCVKCHLTYLAVEMRNVKLRKSYLHSFPLESMRVEREEDKSSERQYQNHFSY